jgi:FlaA1/EpsC-like NDP-sugar epimerase
MVTKMRAIAIKDLAQVMIDLLAPYFNHDPASINIEIIGAKPGEKMYEELISEEEVSRTLELQDMYVVLPAFRAIYQNIAYSYPGASQYTVDCPYNSAKEPPLTMAEIKDFMLNNGLLPTDLSLNIDMGKTRCAS